MEDQSIPMFTFAIFHTWYKFLFNHHLVGTLDHVLSDLFQWHQSTFDRPDCRSCVKLNLICFKLKWKRGHSQCHKQNLRVV